MAYFRRFWVKDLPSFRKHITRKVLPLSLHVSIVGRVSVPHSKPYFNNNNNNSNSKSRVFSHVPHMSSIPQQNYNGQTRIKIKNIGLAQSRPLRNSPIRDRGRQAVGTNQTLFYPWTTTGASEKKTPIQNPMYPTEHLQKPQAQNEPVTS